MRSDTLLSLTEFVQWVGGDVWAFAQIDRSPTQRREKDSCACTVEYEWQFDPQYANSPKRAGANSRETIRQAIRQAERLFTLWTNHYPLPVNIVGEQYPWRLRGLRKLPPKFLTQYAPYLQSGVYVLTALSAAADLTRTDGGGQLLDAFTLTLPVPDNTRADEIRVFLPGEATERRNEIVPLTVHINSSGGTGNWTATISGESYLFVLPEKYLANEPQCVKHEAANYLTTVDVWRQTIDTTQQGVFVFDALGDCNGAPCAEPTTSSLCWHIQASENLPWLVPASITWVEGIATGYTLPRSPDAVRINYIAGFNRVMGRMDEQVKHILCLLTAAYLLCGDGMCCQACATDKLKYYRELQTYKSKDSQFLSSGGESGATHTLLVDHATIARLSGLEPRRGFVQAYGLLRDMGWLTDDSNIIFQH
jgi:hypothetical protein